MIGETWADFLGSSRNTYPYYVAEDQNGNEYIAGNYYKGSVSSSGYWGYWYDGIMVMPKPSDTISKNFNYYWYLQ